MACHEVVLKWVRTPLLQVVSSIGQVGLAGGELYIQGQLEGDRVRVRSGGCATRVPRGSRERGCRVLIADPCYGGRDSTYSNINIV